MSKVAISRGQVGARVRHGETFWRDLIDRQRLSGRTQAAFCSDQGIALSTFSRWSKLLSCGEEATGQSVEFIQLGNVAASPLVSVRLDLGDGLTIEIRRG